MTSERIPDYEVREIRGGVGRDYIRQHHYTRSCHNGPMCWGLFDGDAMIGVIAFATPSSEAVRASIFGVDEKHRVTELHRLFIEDVTPKNTETWFMSRAIKMLQVKRPDLRAIISFADSTEGHEGTIYKAMNFSFKGTTGRSRFWRDAEGRLRHPRQNGHNVTPDEASEKGWIAEMRGAKNRYLLVVGDPAERRKWRKRVLI